MEAPVRPDRFGSVLFDYITERGMTMPQLNAYLSFDGNCAER